MLNNIMKSFFSKNKTLVSLGRDSFQKKDHLKFDIHLILVA
jgi:hypothetical protein